jgi:hypothetical protein
MSNEPEEELKKLQTWPELTAKEKFSRIAWAVATSTALESCESPQEIYRRLMVKYQFEEESKTTE